MDNKDLVTLKIKIGCKNKLAYQDIAYLVDKPDFLTLLPKLRKKYQISKLIPFSEFKNWWVAKIKDDLQIYAAGKMLSEANKFNKNKSKKPTDEEIFNSLPYHERFDWETKLLTREFKRPGYFDLIIKHAIVCGEIDDESWIHTYADVRPWELPTDEVLLPEVSIVISPMTRLKHIQQAFKDAKKLFNENAENLKYYTEIKKTAALEIKRNRDWYWRNIAGESYLDIALTIAPKEYVEMYHKGKGRDYIQELPKVRQAVRRYKKILKTL